MSDPPCRLRTLSLEPGCRIDGCEHGLVHLTLGSLTLRLRPHEVAHLRRALDTAAARGGFPEPTRHGAPTAGDSFH